MTQDLELLGFGKDAIFRPLRIIEQRASNLKHNNCRPKLCVCPIGVYSHAVTLEPFLYCHRTACVHFVLPTLAIWIRNIQVQQSPRSKRSFSRIHDQSSTLRFDINFIPRSLEGSSKRTNMCYDACLCSACKHIFQGISRKVPDIRNHGGLFFHNDNDEDPSGVCNDFVDVPVYGPRLYGQIYICSK